MKKAIIEQHVCYLEHLNFEMHKEIKKLESQNQYFFTLLNKDLLKEISIEVQYNNDCKLFKIPTNQTCVRAY